MSGFSKLMLVVLIFTSSVSFGELIDSGKVDLTKRQSDIEGKLVPMKMFDMKMNAEFMDKRFPIKMWHSKFSDIGNRRAPIEVRETREKTIIQPNVIDMNVMDLKMASMNGRMAFVPNFNRVQENHLVPALRDAEIVTVQEASVPGLTSQDRKEPSMRDINRFTFQRNQSDEGIDTQKAGGSGEEAK